MGYNESEYAVRIMDAGEGKGMAIRVASQSSSGESDTRYIERVDFASGKMPTPFPAPIRGSLEPMTYNDPVYVASVSGEILDNAIEVGDRSMLCATVEMSKPDGYVTLTPFLFDNELSGERPTISGLAGVLEPKTFFETYHFRRPLGGMYITPVQTWDACGAWWAGFHVTSIYPADNQVQVRAWVV